MARREIWTLDMETDPFKAGRIPAPFIIGVFTGSSYHEFETVESCVEFLMSKEVIVYAHNGGKFDYHFMLDYLSRDSEIMLINGRLSKFFIGLCEFRDSYNILPVPLAEYQKDKIDYSIMEPEERYKPENWERIRDYLRGDCIYLYNLINLFIDEFGLHLTQAGAAMKVWQKMCDIKAPKSDSHFYHRFYSFYFGGRVQCFEYGSIKTPFVVADINSAYPYAMLHEHPISTSFVQVKGMVKTIKEIGPCLFEVEGIAQGCFPLRTSEGLYFPDDGERRVYCVTGWELLAALETGTLKDHAVLNSYVFTERINFSYYINTFYERRKKAKECGDKANDIFAKLFMNSLYGKFAACPENYANYVLKRPEEIEAMEIDGFTFAGTLGKWLIGKKPLTEEESRFYNIATAASITGFVRAYLWRAICKAERPLYCDTDSIAAVNLPHIDLGKNLGQWELEGKFTHAYIGGKKLYAFKQDKKGEWKKASKGVRATVRDIQRVAKGQEVTITPKVPTFSAYKAPRFVPRNIVLTAKDSRKPPVKK